ncbi:bridge-like lipid transfer protein family member 3A [Embiotoca jacksoni]|uniref:bridge-like lipid transfer protein family member 3A n=1 Tax=Embiotoca jacksoni TaxID=100190 RepID=UPI00370470D5
MAGIIKKQILKHLSRFTKNLSPDKINLSTLKGEGQLSNLELDEEVLQNMLDLPTWLAVTRVYCNKAAIRIQWTKLKTSPICLFLDKVEVEMRTCEEPRPPNGPSPIAITAGQSEYGFAEKVVEGMSVKINSITIKVQARAFHASFELWQLQGNSLNPKWQRSDLRYTRITFPKRGEVLTFKEINWQSLRIEADAIESDDQDLGSTPLRLITNQGRIRIALKRRIKDCNVLASKLLFILDDLLWVLTDSQLKAIIHYAKSLSEAMEKSAQQRKNMTAESLQTAPPSPGFHSLWTEPPPAPASTANNMSENFDHYDVKESSYHTFISRLDLHICNDSSSTDEDETPPPGLQGAMQLTFRKLGFDYYPVHRPADGCRHWERHSGAMEAHAQWAGKLLQEYQKRAEASGFPGPNVPEEPLPDNESPAKTVQDGQSSPKSTSSRKERSTSSSSATGPPESSLKRLRSSCVVIRMDDVDIHQVSTRGRQNRKTQSLLSCNRKAMRLPDNVPAVHLQFTEYYFSDNPSLPVPTSNLYAQLNGLQLCVDPASVLWINLFSRGLLHTLDQVKAFYHLQDSNKVEEHVHIRMDASQLKLIIPLDSSILDHPERPQSLSVTVPQMTVSNTRHCPHGSRADLNTTCDRFASCPFFQSTPPCPYPRDLSAFHPLPSAFLQHYQDTEPQPLDRKQLRSRDVWSVNLSRVALGFDGARRSPKGKSQPFVEPFAVSVWMCKPSAFKSGSLSSCSSPARAHQPSSEQEAPQEEASLASIHFLAHTITPVKMWLNHYQYVALLRMKDAMARLGAELGWDIRDVKQAHGQKTKAATVCLALLVDSVELGLLLPPVSTEPEEEVPHTPETDSPSITDSDISPTHHSVAVLKDSGLENGTSSVNTAFDQEEQDGVVEEAYEAVEEGPEGNGLTTQEDTPVLSPPLSPGQSFVLSRQPSSFSLEGELSSAINVTKDVTKDAISASLDLTKGAFSITKDAFSMLSRGSGMSKLFSPQAKEQVQRSVESSPSVTSSLRHQKIQQSPSQHSIDSAIMDGSLPDENISMDSDFSDNFVHLMDSESGMESMRPNSTRAGSRGSLVTGTEGGSSADLSSSLSQSTEDVSQDMSSVLVLILNKTACTMEVNGEDQVVAVAAQNLTPVQMGNIRLLDLLTGLTQAPGELVQKQDRQTGRGPPVLCMRAEMGPSAARRSALAESLGFVDMRVQDCRADLLASTVANIGPFLEDEFSAEGQPMKLLISNVTVSMKDDSPKIYPTAPQSVPSTFIIDQLLLERSDDGLMKVKAAGTDPKASAGVPVTGTDDSNSACSVQQQAELCEAQAALTQALRERERLLLEVRKHDPTFTL